MSLLDQSDQGYFDGEVRRQVGRIAERLRRSADRIERMVESPRRADSLHPMADLALDVMGEVRGLAGNLSQEDLVRAAADADVMRARA